MSSIPATSVIIIFHNTEKYISESIQSVIDQTYQNWELILVDDGSSDGSTNIALDYLQKYPDKILYVEHENHVNKGMSASRNIGAKHSKGKYLAFLDSDDLWYPQTLSEQVNILNSHANVGAVFGKYLNWYSWSGDNELNEQDAILPEWEKYDIKLDGIVNPPLLIDSYLKHGYRVKTGTCSVIIRKDTFNKVGGYVDSFTKNFEDHVLFLKICLEDTVYISSRCWSKYRRHIESSTKHKNSAYERKFLRILLYSWFEHYMSDKKNKYPQIWDSMQNNYRNLVDSYMDSRLSEKIKINKLENRLKELEKK